MVMQGLSNDELREIRETDHVQCGDASNIASELLRVREALPVAWQCLKNGPGRYVITQERVVANYWLSKGWPVMELKQGLVFPTKEIGSVED